MTTTHDIYSLLISEIRIVLTGTAGNGKSTSGNTILGKEVFPSKVSSLTVTKECQYQTLDSNGIKYLIVDTPAFSNLPWTDRSSVRELAKVLGITYPGFHVLIVVVKVGRFTQQEKKIFEKLASIFGKELYKRIIILFTGLDKLMEEDKPLSFKSYVKYHLSAELERIVKNFANCTVGFNNKGDDKVRSEHVHELLSRARAISTKYGAFKIEKINRPIESESRQDPMKLQQVEEGRINDDLIQQMRLDIQQGKTPLLGKLEVILQESLDNGVPLVSMVSFAPWFPWVNKCNSQ